MIMSNGQQEVWVMVKQNMYINKAPFLICRIVGSIGLWLSGSLSILMTLGFVFDILHGDTSAFNSAILKPYFIFLMLSVVFCFFTKKLERAKLYDSFFAEDPDGIMQSHVLAKATGIKQEKLVRDLDLLRKLHLFRLDMEPGDGYTVITLYEPKTGAKAEHIYENIRCPECGAMNRVRRGFVHTCAYCLGSLEEGVQHVSE